MVVDAGTVLPVARASRPAARTLAPVTTAIGRRDPPQQSEDPGSIRWRPTQVGALAALVSTTGLWLLVARDAWRVRAVVASHEAVHGEVSRPVIGPWPDHLQQLNDALFALGVGYFYPFGPLIPVLVAAAWACSLALVDFRAWIGVGGGRRVIGALGLVALVVQLVLVADALTTYVVVTE